MREGPESGSSKAHSRNREVKTWEMAGKERKENHAESCRPSYRLPTSRCIEGTKELKYRERKRKASLSGFKASHI